MRKSVIALIATFAIAGCASVSTDRVDSIESRLAALEGQMEEGAGASAAANRASQEASAAQAAAQRALDAANQANARAERIAETCCARK